MDVENALRQIRGKAALLRYLASCGSLNVEQPDPQVLAGMGEACEEIETLAVAVREALDVDALGVELARPKPR